MVDRAHRGKKAAFYYYFFLLDGVVWTPRNCIKELVFVSQRAKFAACASFTLTIFLLYTYTGFYIGFLVITTLNINFCGLLSLSFYKFLLYCVIIFSFLLCGNNQIK